MLVAVTATGFARNGGGEEKSKKEQNKQQKEAAVAQEESESPEQENAIYCEIETPDGAVVS